MHCVPYTAVECERYIADLEAELSRLTAELAEAKAAIQDGLSQHYDQRARLADELAAARSEGAAKDKARGVLRLLWQWFDSEGISNGRSRHAMLLETAMKLLGPCPDTECRDGDADQRQYVIDAREMAHLCTMERSIQDMYADHPPRTNP